MSSQKPSLESFRETVRSIASGIYENWNSPNLNEAAVRQVVVLRLLQAAGFNIWNPLEIIPEETSSGGGRIDILVKIEGEATCAKCTLKTATACQAAITVTGADGKKETILADNNDVSKAFHKTICTDTKKVKAEGVITEKDGKKTIALTKIELAK